MESYNDKLNLLLFAHFKCQESPFYYKKMSLGIFKIFILQFRKLNIKFNMIYNYFIQNHLELPKLLNKPTIDPLFEKYNPELSKELQTDFTISFESIPDSVYLKICDFPYEKLPDRCKNDGFLLKMLDKDPNYIKYVKYPSEEVCMKLIKQDYNLIKHMKILYPDVIKTALNKDIKCIEYIKNINKKMFIKIFDKIYDFFVQFGKNTNRDFKTKFEKILKNMDPLFFAMILAYGSNHILNICDEKHYIEFIYNKYESLDKLVKGYLLQNINHESFIALNKFITLFLKKCSQKEGSSVNKTEVKDSLGQKKVLSKESLSDDENKKDDSYSLFNSANQNIL